MQLVWIRIRKYRRFSEAQTLRFTGKLTALVGPNEAGKTSLLEILTHLNRDEAFARLDVTRGEQAGDQPLLEVCFFLEPADQQALGDIPGGKNVRWLKVSKDQEGPREFGIEPDLHRDLRPRRRTADQLRQALAHPLLSKRGERNGRARRGGIAREAGAGRARPGCGRP